MSVQHREVPAPDRDPPDVEFIRSASRWKKYPFHLMAALQKGVADVRRLRADIVASAKVPAMPFVRVYDEIWMSPDDPSERTLHEAYGGVSLFEDHYRPFVDMAATTPLTGDDGLIRALLVHEFSHCFYMLSQVVTNLDAGKKPWFKPPGYDPLSPESDRQVMVHPSEWFGDSDVANFAHWNDPRLQLTWDKIEELQLHRHLKRHVFVRPKLLELDYVMDDRIVAHIRALNAKKSFPLPGAPTGATDLSR